MDTFYQSKGKLKYDEPYYPKGSSELSFKLTVEVDKGIGDYYRSMIPKYNDFQPQMYNPHITVVRKEVPKNLEFWEKYAGEEVEFCYSNVVYEGEVYFWLNVFSKKLEEIREELGLSAQSRYTLPPEGFKKFFHITLANKKFGG